MREPVDTRIAFLGLGVRELQPYNMDYKGMCVNLYGEEYFFWNTRVTTMHLNFICSRAVRASERERSLRSFVRSFVRSFLSLGWSAAPESLWRGSRTRTKPACWSC